MIPLLSPTQQRIKSAISMIVQMSLTLTLFCVFLALSAEGTPFGAKQQKCGYDACGTFDPDTFTVHLIPHSHDDVGWLKTPDQYYFQDVANVISSVVDALKQNSTRRFIQVETAFFKKWWVQQKDTVKEAVQVLVDNGQFEFINAGWTQNDEAAVYYQSTIDQFTLGLRYIQDNLGECARPKVAWQIDPFGHSREQASISARLGFDSLFFARLDYRDKNRRLDDKTMDLLWRGSQNLAGTDIFTSVLYRHYSAPPGFCFDIVCNDEVIIDDEESPEFNLDRRVNDFANFVREQSAHYPTNHILVTMGDDFRYEAAMTTYLNLDRLVRGFEKYEQKIGNKRIKVIYSTPSCYTKAVNDFVNSNNFNLELKTDDFFPYADSPNAYWTGYFTSRPASKHFERQGNNLLQVAKQLGAQTQELYENAGITALKDILGIMQHHDAITGTEKQHVANNYHFLLARGMQQASDTAGSILSNLIGGSASTLTLNSCLLSNVSSCLFTQSDQFNVVVYNPLSRPVTTPVSVPIYDRQDWTILDPEGNDVSYQIEESPIDFSYVENAPTSKDVLVFVAKDVPALGFSVYQFSVKSKSKDRTDPLREPKVLVGYNDTNFEINEQSGLLQAITMNGVRVEIEQDFQFYTSRSSSGAYILAPSTETNRIADGPITTTPVNGDVYQGVLQEFGSWAKQFIRVYNDDRSFVEFDWIVGPIDISDGVGKEIISKFTTGLSTEGVFYTDSNGREFLKRQRNYRADYKYTNEEPIAGNYYPVNTFASIRDEDANIEVAVIPDRAEGGSSITDGELELMVHRACQNDDGRGVGENLNEQEYGNGIRVRGKHFLVLGKKEGDNQKGLKVMERELALKKTLQPWVFVNNNSQSGDLQVLEWSGLRQALPENVHVLTVEPWGEKLVLLRFEHILEKDDDVELSKEVTIDVSELFSLFTVTQLTEMTLGANVVLSESQRLHWPGALETNIKDVDDLTVTLAPMEIRTFVAKVTYT